MTDAYTAVATSEGGRQGHVRSSDGVLDLPLSLPKELGGTGRPGATNPEQLFAGGYAACFENAVLRVARERKVPVKGTSVTARVGIGRGEDSLFHLNVKLEVTIPGLARAEAEELARVAHEEVCPYSRAVKGNIEVAVTVT